MFQGYSSNKKNDSGTSTKENISYENNFEKSFGRKDHHNLRIPEHHFVTQVHNSINVGVIQRQGNEEETTKKDESKARFHLQLTEPDLLSMRRPFLNRSVLHLWDPASALGVWRFNFNFFKNVGLADNLAGKAANLTAPFAIDAQLKAGNPTWWEITDKDLKTTSLVGSAPIFGFDANFKNWKFLPFLQQKPLDNIQVSYRQDNNFIQKKCTCEDEEVRRKPLTSFIQKKSAESTDTPYKAIEDQIEATRGNGSTLPDRTKTFMESRFGADFSKVRVHSGGYASQMSNELNAQAFTIGNDIYFNSGKFSPESSAGKHLLAHELTHTIQQGGNTQNRGIHRTIGV